MNRLFMVLAAIGCIALGYVGWFVYTIKDWL
jgi:preprotein translocase subunit Sss1